MSAPKPLEAILLLALFGASASAQDAPATQVDFSGRWKSTFGPLELHQSGGHVEGSYDPSGRSTISGDLAGRRLTFRYTEPAVKGEGWFELSADGRSFAGMWREDGGEWSEWTGTLLARPRAAGPFDGLFHTGKGRLRLIHDKGGPVRGTYVYAGTPGTLRGKVTERTLQFTWREEGANGDGQFTLSADGKLIDGEWRSASTGKGGVWQGQRLSARPRVKWLMILEAQWEESLVEQEYSFGAMLRAYFRRYPHVQVRHRRFNDRPDFLRGVRELALLGEPVVLVVASHGEQGKLVAGDDRIDPKELGALLNDAPDVQLVHFSSCELMVGDVPTSIQEQIQGRRVPLSGYAVSVDWSASAILEFLYFDLVLGRHMDPARAATLVRAELGFATDEGTPGSPLGGSHFRFVD